MNNIEQHVTSLALSKRLHELGIKKKSVFSYVAFENPPYGICKPADVTDDRWDIYLNTTRDKCPPDYYVTAYLASELGEFLPTEIPPKSGSGSYKELTILHCGGMWFVGYKKENGWVLPIAIEPNECEARAKMLIHLIEEGIVKVEDLNDE